MKKNLFLLFTIYTILISSAQSMCCSSSSSSRSSSSALSASSSNTNDKLVEKLYNLIRCEAESIDEVKKFLESIKGTNIINMKHYGRTILSNLCACVGGENCFPDDEAIIDLLLNYGADPNIADDEYKATRMTPFAHAAIYKNLKIANLLYNKNANITPEVYYDGKKIKFTIVIKYTKGKKL